MRSLTTQWIDISQSLALTYVAIQLIDSIWTIGRYRCLVGDATCALFFRHLCSSQREFPTEADALAAACERFGSPRPSLVSLP
jgi:hypothetical protein